MWVAKFQVSRETSIFEVIARKSNVTIIAYPLTSFKRHKRYYFSAAGTLIGDEKKKIKAFNLSKKDKRIKKIEQKGDFFILVYERDELLKRFYNPEFMQIKPIIINSKGEEIWELGSWNKSSLMKLISYLRKSNLNFKLFKLKQEKLSNLAIVNLIPDLTKKQKKALGLAVINGYYDYPKKIELKKLAKFMKISYSTYQAHLKKAEGKLIPYSFGNL